MDAVLFEEERKKRRKKKTLKKNPKQPSPHQKAYPF